MFGGSRLLQLTSLSNRECRSSLDESYSLVLSVREDLVCVVLLFQFGKTSPLLTRVWHELPGMANWSTTGMVIRFVQVFTFHLGKQYSSLGVKCTVFHKRRR